MILGFFPKKAAFPPFFRHSRPEAGRAAVLKCAAFLPPKKPRQKEMSAGRRCSHSTGVRRAPSPLFLKTEEISARTRPGKEPGQWQYALPAREVSSKAALWGEMGPVAVPGVQRTPSPLFLKTEEISARTRSGKEPGQWQYAGTALPRFCSMAAVRSRKIRLCRNRRRNNSSSSPL